MTTKNIDRSLTFIEFLHHQLKRTGNTPQWLAEVLEHENDKIVKGILAGTIKAPVSMVNPIARAFGLNPSIPLHIYVSDYLPDLDDALFDCNGMTILTPAERKVIDSLRRFKKETEPEIAVFETARMVVAAIT